jgi:hypothetical protein
MTPIDRNIHQLTVDTLEATHIHAKKKDEKNENSFSKLSPHQKQMILNASALYPFTEATDTPTEFCESILTKKSAFKAKQLTEHELSTMSIKCFKESPALTASIWIGNLIFQITVCPERLHNNTKERELKKDLWMDEKHIRSDIQILSKTTNQVPDGIIEAYALVLNFKTLFQLLLGQGCEIDLFLSNWLDHIFSNRELSLIQQDDDCTFLAQALHFTKQAIHLHLDSCCKNTKCHIRDNLLNHEGKWDLIQQRNFVQNIPSAIKSLFTSTEHENDKNFEKGRNTKETKIR